jgi:hypothetical protein
VHRQVAASRRKTATVNSPIRREYFHGDNGAGRGASHQTGWTGLTAVLLDLFVRLEAKDLEIEREQVSARLVREQVSGERKVGGGKEE